jgi:hypothetical protein
LVNAWAAEIAYTIRTILVWVSLGKFAIFLALVLVLAFAP